jgi:hypothetical protein
MKAKGTYEADDRGNVVDFYEIINGEYHQVARLDREAEPDDHTTWDGAVDVTVWAIANGYAEEIADAELI